MVCRFCGVSSLLCGVSLKHRQAGQFFLKKKIGQVYLLYQAAIEHAFEFGTGKTVGINGVRDSCLRRLVFSVCVV